MHVRFHCKLYNNRSVAPYWVVEITMKEHESYDLDVSKSLNAQYNYRRR